MTITGGVAGCGVVNELSAKQKVSKAMSSFEDADSASFTISLDTTASDVAAIAAAVGDPMSAEDQKILEKVVDGDIVYSLRAADGKKLSDSMDTSATMNDTDAMLRDPQKFADTLKQAGDFAMAVRLSGDSLIELRFKDGLFYARAAVRKIMGLAGEDAAQLDQQLQGLPPALAPLQKAARGEWVSVDLTELVTSLKDSGALDELPTPAATPSIDASAVPKLLDDLKAAYEQKVTITELEESDRGQQFQLSAPAREIAAAVQDDMIAIAGDAFASDVRKTIADIPNKPVTMNVWVKDDKLSGVAFDLTQFMDGKPAGAKLAVDVAVDLDSGEIETPSGATALDVKALMDEVQTSLSALGGGAGGAGGLGDYSGSGYTMKELEEMGLGSAGSGSGSGSGGSSMFDEPAMSDSF